MKNCTDTVTWWHKENGRYTRIVLAGCKWSENIVRDVTNGIAAVTSAFTVILPKEQTDCAPKVGDLMAIGEHEYEITGERGQTSADLKKALSPHIMTVKAVKNLTRNPNGGHYRTEGV